MLGVIERGLRTIWFPIVSSIVFIYPLGITIGPIKKFSTCLASTLLGEKGISYCVAYKRCRNILGVVDAFKLPQARARQMDVHIKDLFPGMIFYRVPYAWLFKKFFDSLVGEVDGSIKETERRNSVRCSVNNRGSLMIINVFDSFLLERLNHGNVHKYWPTLVPSGCCSHW